MKKNRFQRAHLRAKHGLPVHEDERETFDETDMHYQQVHPENSKYQFVWDRQGVPNGIPDIAVDRGELCRCHLRRCPVCRNCTKRHCWCPGGPMDPFAPASIPRRKRGGTTSFEQNHAPRDFRATLTEEQQMLYNPRIGTTRFAYEKQITLQGNIGISKFKSSVQHKSLIYQKRMPQPIRQVPNPNNVTETYVGRFQKQKPKNKRSAGGSKKDNNSSSSNNAGVEQMKKKPKVDNRTKWYVSKI